ncbi:cupin 2 domain-containing protein [Terrimicrobium sacchariphilum]|uniref:Cupin 2 domain-containing protein n=1 Tax=Terrimicrobium sacchariphilum TaxID=690879 RepID=A0A146G2C1_TERSA|nr:cupin domain-containing protein [Terrimicrobium sacchariphilum]GAT31790.1 cupin 2 domain-containing protein [Terrimicrobium sacchariphilum]
MKENLLPLHPGATEEFRQLLDGNSFRLEHIISHGECSPPGFWYDQEQEEWVTLLRGEATLAFDDGARQTMSPGDAVLIPAHRRHRVESVSVDAVWLALHFSR